MQGKTRVIALAFHRQVARVRFRSGGHMWVKFVVGSLLCFERFFSWFSGFPKTNISKLQFDRMPKPLERNFW